MEQLLNKSNTKKDEKSIKDEKQNEMIEETNDLNLMKQRIANALNESKTSPKEKVMKEEKTKDSKNKKNGETLKGNIEKFDKLLNKQNKRPETKEKPKPMKELTKEMEMNFQKKLKKSLKKVMKSQTILKINQKKMK